MSIALFDASIPTFIHALKNLRHVLSLGQAHAEAKGFEPAVLLQTRLTPDMFPLIRQVQIACDIAKNGGARLAGMEPPKFEDTEVDFAQLHDRIERVIAFLESLAADQINGQEDRAITIKTPTAELQFTGQDYLLQFSHPNLYFHCSMTYAILRQSGVAVGKLDFLGAIGQHGAA